MCGLFGIVADPKSLSREAIEHAVTRLFLLSETRGKESAGIAIVLSDQILFQKSAVRPKEFLRTSHFKSFFAKAMKAVYAARQPFAVFGHSRLVTNGAQNVHANNQPVLSGGILGVHNGIIVNDADLWAAMPSLTREAEVDTEVMLQVLRHELTAQGNLVSALKATFQRLKGTVSTALAFHDINALVLATNNGSLYTAHDPARSALVFASERPILEGLFENDALGWPVSGETIQQVHADEALIVSLGDLIVSRITLDNNQSGTAARLEVGKTQRVIRDETPVAAKDSGFFNSAPHVASGNFSCFEIDPAPIQALKRCTRCILPETIPFIAFDEKGVCTFCNTYKPKVYHGRAALDAKAEAIKAKRSAEGADCLFTLSGGRDSSYGLHYAVRELGLKPIAYTYDWGMITDLARRNQARMCGALKIEHILVSADIAAKRANIRRNVSAWLKKPELGMIPLFMAGDKQYFFHANELGRKLRLDTTVLASNPLEKTHFKAGFCGVAPSLTHRPALASQMQMASYYGLQFLKNPRYLNRSLIDTAGAFASYYFIKHNYLRLFDYVPWVEEDVNNTLLQTYDWETSPDTPSTWRIGDGTAAFYNYIYYRVAGFTENDTFRSNQIREGVMDRAQALRMSEIENRPRFQSIAWYCSVIGLDPTDVLARIATIPPLYPR